MSGQPPPLKPKFPKRPCKRCGRPFIPEGKWITRCNACHSSERLESDRMMRVNRERSETLDELTGNT